MIFSIAIQLHSCAFILDLYPVYWRTEIETGEREKERQTEREMCRKVGREREKKGEKEREREG